MNNATRATGFLIETDDVSQIEPQARAAIKDALMAALPDVTVSRVLAAEKAVVDALRKKGFLPPAR
jgi:hypothetical protein